MTVIKTVQNFEGNNQEKQVLEYVNEKKLIVTPKAIKLLAKQQNFKEIVDELIEKNNFILNNELIENLIVRKNTKIEIDSKPDSEIKNFNPIAKQLKERLNFESEKVEEFIGNSVKDISLMFQDRFNYLSGILKKRNGLNPKELGNIHRISKNREIDIIGIVEKKWISKNGHLCLMVEDLTGSALVLILKNDAKLMELGQNIILDDIIGIKGRKGEGEMVLAQQIFYPEIPMRPLKKSERDVSMIVLSDIHVGSKLFLEKEFNRFLDWLNGKVGDEKEKEKVGKIKYILIAGDLVDGIGIYPNQFDELNIIDIFEQYEKLQKLLKKIPKYIHVIIIPGNHDAVRKADPQPPIPKKFLPELYELNNFHFVGSPSWVEIEGLKVLLYHGNSMHDLYSQISGLDSSKPEKAIIEGLKRNCLAFTYGFSQPYLTTTKDFMTLKEYPDIYVGGDMHHSGYGQYRGTLIVNGSTFQAQTDYQLKFGHHPNPGVVPLIELKTMKITENCFYKEE